MNRKIKRAILFSFLFAALILAGSGYYFLAVRQKLTKRMSPTGECYYQLPGRKISGTTNSLSFSVDIETGGHVF